MKRKIHQTTHRESELPGGRQLTLAFHADGSPEVPASLLLPSSAEPVPGVLLIHGYSSRKEQLADTVGRALLLRGVASLAIDLPLHGTRRQPVQAQAIGSPLEILSQWRLAVKETHLAVRYLEARREIDSARLAAVGYSLGSFLATLLTAKEPGIRALVIAAGGDLPSNTPFGALARTVADPPRAVRKLSGRPLLMVHGRRDRTVLPEQAQRLFDAASQPKEIRWCDSGHHLPESAIGGAADWLLERFG